MTFRVDRKPHQNQKTNQDIFAFAEHIDEVKYVDPVVLDMNFSRKGKIQTRNILHGVKEISDVYARRLAE